ncbi:MAG: glycosyltransferase family 2 protein [Bacteroidetes bacterium]|nr:glycosyltransferase family 2 protein [Bacteroidota bacterium]
MADTKFSVIVPVYNSEDTLEEFFTRLNKILQQSALPFEIIFVDDHSVDSSWTILKKIKSNNSALIKIIRLTANFGQHNATLCGLCQSSGEIVITMDDDLQHPPEEIPKLIEAMGENQADMVYGIDDNYLPLFRKISSNFLKLVSKKIMRQYGEWSSFRLIRRSLADNIRKHQYYYVNIDQIAYKYTNKINFVKVKMVKRAYGRSGYSLLKLFSSWCHAAILFFKLPLRSQPERPPFLIKEELL